MSLWLCALLFMKLQFPLVVRWVGCLPFSPHSRLEGPHRTALSWGGKGTWKSSSLSSCSSELGALFLCLRVCDREMAPIPGKPREYGLSLMTNYLYVTLVPACLWVMSGWHHWVYCSPFLEQSSDSPLCTRESLCSWLQLQTWGWHADRRSFDSCCVSGG